MTTTSDLIARLGLDIGQEGSSWDPLLVGALPALPSDYLELVGKVGPFEIDEFLWVTAPNAHDPLVDIANEIERCTSILRDLRNDGEDIPFPIYPESEGLLPVAFTIDGDEVYWLTKGEPSSWTIVVNEVRAPNWHEFSGGIVSWFIALLDGEEKVPFFPEEFLDGHV